MKNSASMYESSGSHLFRITTERQTGPDTYDNSKLVMIFVINLGVTRILYTLRLVQEGNAGNEIPESTRFKFLEKILANSLIRRRQHLRPLI